MSTARPESSMQHSSVVQVVDAIRNTRDVDTNLRGLNQLRRALESGANLAFLQQYTSYAGGFDDLQGVWDAQLTVQNYHVTVTLLLALADVLTLIASTRHQQQPQQEADERNGPSRELQDAAAALVQAILSRRLKAIYFNLSSEMRGKANAALTLLAAVAAQGSEATRELARAFDFSLAALPNLARLPRQRKGDTHGEEAENGAGLQARLWQQWTGGDALKRPTRVGFVAFALGMLRHADPLTLATLLATRPLMGGLLNHMARDPLEVQLQVLGVVRGRVLSHKAGVPAAAQAEVLSDAVLSQLSQMALTAHTDDTTAEGHEEGAQQAANLAYRLLAEVATDPRHGLCSAPAADEGGTAVTLASAVSGQLSAGQKRLLRWLQRLRPAESAAHMELIAACTAVDPALAVALLLSLPFTLEPALSGRWLAQAAVAGGLMQRVAAMRVGLSQLAQRGAPAPASDSKLMLALLRCALPPCVPKAALSRGVQHSSTLVRHTTLCLLARILDTAAALLRDIATAEAQLGESDEPLQSGSAAGLPSRGESPNVGCVTLPLASSRARQRWAELWQALQAAVRAGLPDPQPLLALFGSLERSGAGQGQTAKAGSSNDRRTAAAAAAEGADALLAGQAKQHGLEEDEEDVVVMISGEVTETPLGGPASAGNHGRGTNGSAHVAQGEPHEDGSGALEQHTASKSKSGLAAANPELLSALLRVLVGWERSLPGALAESHVDVERLVPQDLLALQPHHQHLFLELLLAQLPAPASSSSELPLLRSFLGPSGRGALVPLPATLLLPVLRLLCGTQHGEVCQLARRWALARLAAGAFDGHAEEALVWVDLLPRSVDCPSAPAVCGFLTDALMQLQRKPHEFFELAQQPDVLPSSGSGSGSAKEREVEAAAAAPAAALGEGLHGNTVLEGPLGCSLLALCALRQALRVLPSPKMASSDKAAICAYVAAVLGMLCQQQHSTHSNLSGSPAVGEDGDVPPAPAVDRRSNGQAAQRFVRALLGVLRLEAQRTAQQQQQHKQQGGSGGAAPEGALQRLHGNETSHGAVNAYGTPTDSLAAELSQLLPSDGQCILSLAEVLEAQLQPGPARPAAVANGWASATGPGLGTESGTEHPRKKRKKSMVGEAAQEGHAAPEARLDREQLSQLAQQGQQAQQAATALRHSLLCAPRAEAAAALPTLAASALPGGTPQQPAAKLAADICSAHVLPLPLPETLVHSGLQQEHSMAAYKTLLEAAPLGLLQHSLAACCCLDSATPRNHDSSSSSGHSAGSSLRLHAGAEVLAALQRRLASEAGSCGYAEQGLQAVGLVRHCLYWLERATSALQVQWLFQALQLVLGSLTVPAPAEKPQQGCSMHQAQTAALALLAAHPTVQASLASSQQQQGETTVHAAVALGTVSLLRQQLSGAAGTKEAAAVAAACKPLLHLAAGAFLTLAQAAAGGFETMAGRGGTAGAATSGKERKEEKKRRKDSQEGNGAAADSASARGAALGVASMDLPPAALYWEQLLPWMEPGDVQEAARLLLLGCKSQSDSLADPLGAQQVATVAGWVAGTASSTISQLVRGGQEMLGNSSLLRPCCTLLALLVVSSSQGALARKFEDCLLTLLSGPHSQPAIEVLEAPLPHVTLGTLPANSTGPNAAAAAAAGEQSASVALMKACLARPSATAARLLLVLVTSSSAARVCFGQEAAAVLQRGFQGEAQTSGRVNGSNKRKDGRKGSKERKASLEQGQGQRQQQQEGGFDPRLLLACLLPAATAVLQAAVQVPAGRSQQQARGAGSDLDSARSAGWQTQAAELAACLRGPLLTFLAGRQASAAEHALRKKASAEAAPAAAAAGHDSLAAMLHVYAVPALQLCLEIQPPSQDEQDRLLAQLLPAKAFGRGVATTPSEPEQQQLRGAHHAMSDSLAPTAAEVAQAAMAVLRLLQTRPGRRPSPALLLRYLHPYAATLAALFKVTELSPSQRQLEALLLGHLDGALGDAVAALPAAERATQAFARLAEAACSLGTAVLRHRFVDPTVMRTLRRFMAALLPDDNAAPAAAGGGSEGPQGPASGEEGAEPAQLQDAGVESSKVVPTVDRDSSSSSESSRGDETTSSSGDDSEGEDTSSESSDSEGRPLGRGTQPAAKLPGSSGDSLPNLPVAASALELLQRVMTHSRFVAAMRAGAACPPALTAGAEDLPRPLQSLLPLAELPEGCLAAASNSASALKKELCELLETLLDLQEVYGGDEAGQAASGVQQAEAALLPLLMAGYGASLSPTDRAVWSLAQAINLRLWRRSKGQVQPMEDGGSSSQSDSDRDGSADDGDWAQESDDSGREAVAALLEGPLADTGLAWGAAATALQASGLRSAETEEGRKLLQAKLRLDPLRCALAAVHFPESRGLGSGGDEQPVAAHPPAVPAGSADSSSKVAAAEGGWSAALAALGTPVVGPCTPTLGAIGPAAWPSPTAKAAAASLPALPYAEAGYDPAFLLPFCVVALRRQLLPARTLLQAGAPALCLRSLAAADDALRGLAYEAVALLEEQLDKEEFREKRQLSVLLGAVRSAVTTPFQRLPAVVALFCAEASLAVMYPGAPMYPPINRYLLRKAVLDLQEVPLFGQLMLGGSPQHGSERRWLLQLLLAGLRGPEDARLYRRRYVLELAMSLHDSPVAEPHASLLALRIICRTTFVPRAARQLVDHSGLIPWLAAAACRAAAASGMAGLASQQQGQLEGPGGVAAGGSGGEAGATGRACCEALAALLRLTQLRAVAARVGAREVHADLADAVQQVAAAAGLPAWELAQRHGGVAAVHGGAMELQQPGRAQAVGVGEGLQALAAAVRGLGGIGGP